MEQESERTRRAFGFPSFGIGNRIVRVHQKCNALGQKIESVERGGIVPVRRSLGKLWTNYTLRKRRILR
jgi:hypothetical protein